MARFASAVKILVDGWSESEIEGARKRFSVMGSGACFRSAEQRLELDRVSVAATKGGELNRGKICSFMWVFPHPHITEFSLLVLQELSTGPCSELYDWIMPSQRVALRFCWIFSYSFCLGLPSGVLIWGHCVLEIQWVTVCLYWNFYCVVTSRTVFWGVYTISWECYTYVCDDWLRFVCPTG